MGSNELPTPMLAMDLKPEHFNEVADNPDYLMEPKLDGVRALMKVDGADIAMWTRQGNDLIARVPHLAVEAMLSSLPSGYYDMELGVPVENSTIYPTLDFNKTMRILGSSPQEAVRKGSNQIQAYVFDYIRADSPEATLYARQSALLFTELPKGFNMIMPESYNDKVFDLIVKEGGEGIMLKNKNSFYGWGKRRKGTWYKVKKYETMDVYVIGFEWGEGKYENQIGALIFSIHPEGSALGKCSGMTDSERREWTNLLTRAPGINRIPTDYRLIEIKHYGKVGADQKGLRHPQYLKWKRPV